MEQPIVLHTERLLLREFEETDWPAVHAYASDPEIYRYRRPWPAVMEEQTRKNVSEIIQRNAERPRVEWFLAVLLKTEDRLIGECFLRRLEAEGTAFMGYSLNRRYWRQGYMTEAARALVAFGFRELGLRCIEAGCHPDNIASWRVMEKIGMRPAECPYEYHPGKPGSPPGRYYLIDIDNEGHLDGNISR